MLRTVGFCCLLLMCSLPKTRGADVAEELPRRPTEHIAGNTYEVLDVYQSYPVDRRDTDQSWKIFGTCHKLSGSRELLHSLPGDRYVQVSKPCRSILRNCRYDETMQNRASFCVSRDPRRRYDFMDVQLWDETIRYGSNITGDCPSSKTEVYVSYATYYSCLCDCENTQLQTDRHFSQEDVVADEGKVITGVRFRKIDHVFYIQIQQGRLGPNRTILGEVKWKAISKIDPQWLPLPKYDGEYFLKFHRSDWIYTVTNDQNTVLLDNLVGGPNEVLTGLKFRHIGNDLRLEVKITPLTLGGTDKLATWSSKWLHNPINRDMREEVTPPVPNTAFNVSSAGHQFVRFQVSDFKMDLGQTTVPFIDTSNVVSKRPRPLSGVGIFLKGSPSLAGSIAFKLF